MKRGVVTLSLVAVLAAVSPSTPQAPVAVLHRTSAGAHLSPSGPNPLVVLVIGSDVRSGDPAAGRADSLHLVVVNQATKRGTVIGIPRDTYVNIPGTPGQSKINDSLIRGGPTKVAETVSSISGLPIHYWALIDFSRFQQLVDRLDGLDVDVPYNMDDKDSGARFHAGRHHMRGDSVLAFSRNRHGVPGGDIGRSENQGRVLLSGLAKFRAETGDPFAMLKYLDAFRDLATTQVPADELLRLGLLMRAVDPAGLRNVVIPVREGTAGTASVVFLEPGAAQVFAAVRDDGEL